MPMARENMELVSNGEKKIQFEKMKKFWKWVVAAVVSDMATCFMLLGWTL